MGSIKVKGLNELKDPEALRMSEQLRPLRLLPVGKKAVWTMAGADFFKSVREENLQISYVENPKSKGYASRLRYHRYSRAGALREVLDLGATEQDFEQDYRRGFIKFPSHEPDLPGRVNSAVEVAADHGIHRILDGVGRLVSPGVCADYFLGRAFATPTLERAKYEVNEVLKSAFEPDLLLREIGAVAGAARCAERLFAKVMNV